MFKYWHLHRLLRLHRFWLACWLLLEWRNQFSFQLRQAVQLMQVFPGTKVLLFLDFPTFLSYFICLGQGPISTGFASSPNSVLDALETELVLIFSGLRVIFSSRSRVAVPFAWKQDGKFVAVFPTWVIGAVAFQNSFGRIHPIWYLGRRSFYSGGAPAGGIIFLDGPEREFVERIWRDVFRIIERLNNLLSHLLEVYIPFWHNEYIV